MDKREVWYVMIDRPALRVQGSRRVRQINKPRREHYSFLSAHTEAIRLAKKTKSRAMVLKVEIVVEPAS